MLGGNLARIFIVFYFKYFEIIIFRWITQGRIQQTVLGEESVGFGEDFEKLDHYLKIQSINDSN